MSSDSNAPDYNLAEAVKHNEDMSNESIHVHELEEEKASITSRLYNSSTIITKPDFNYEQRRFDQLTLEETAIFYRLQFPQ